MGTLHEMYCLLADRNPFVGHNGFRPPHEFQSSLKYHFLFSIYPLLGVLRGCMHVRECMFTYVWAALMQKVCGIAI